MSLNAPFGSQDGEREGDGVVEGIVWFAGDDGLHGALRYWPVPELVALDLPGGRGFVDALRAVWDTGDAAAVLDARLPDPARQGILRSLRPTRIVGPDGEHHALREVSESKKATPSS